MTMYLSSTQAERESATVYRMGFEMIGILMVLAVQGPFATGLFILYLLNELQLIYKRILKIFNDCYRFRDQLFTKLS
jgi:hypothetical protein